MCNYFIFQVKQHEFREQFRTEPIFKMNLEEPYKLIDKVCDERLLLPVS